MTQAAKRISKGFYTYRGWTIENMAMHDSTCKFWNLIAPGEESAHDSFDSLGQAKAMIDYWIDRT